MSFAPLWGKWIAADGADGERPPDEILNNVEIHAQIATTTTREQLAELQEKLLRSQADNLWYIGTAANEAFAVFPGQSRERAAGRDRIHHRQRHRVAGRDLVLQVIERGKPA